MQIAASQGENFTRIVREVRGGECLHKSSRIATTRSRSVSGISCSSATCFSAVAASGAYAKSMNFAGVFVISETRHRNRRSRGFVFLALAIRTLIGAVAI